MCEHSGDVMNTILFLRNVLNNPNLPEVLFVSWLSEFINDMLDDDDYIPKYTAVYYYGAGYGLLWTRQYNEFFTNHYNYFWYHRAFIEYGGPLPNWFMDYEDWWTMDSGE